MEAERARIEIDVSALILEAIRAKEEKECAAEPVRTSEEIAAEKEKSFAAFGWYCTSKQIEKINRGNREAVDEFFEDNAKRIKYMAIRAMSSLGYRFRKGRNKAGAPVVYVPFCEIDDFINQGYIELRSGKFTLDFNGKSISFAIFRAMYYAPVGGYPEDRTYQYKGKRRRDV